MGYNLFEDGEFMGFLCAGCDKELVRKNKPPEGSIFYISEEEYRHIKEHIEVCIEVKWGRKKKRKIKTS